MKQLKQPSDGGRSVGSTASERYLAQLANRTFLDLWSYPNLFIDKKKNGRGDGKELCDLLVVCGDHVLIFSDKHISWPDGDNLNLSWSRWFKRAVVESAKQIRGAERWIATFPNRIFLDRQCTVRFPLELPPPDRRKVHGLVIANGALTACQNYYPGSSGSLVVKGDLKGRAHIDPTDSTYLPFAVGDVDTNGSFIHVMNEATLNVLMSELDTITDLVGYLEKKEQFLRSGRLLMAHGEEDLVACYITQMNEKDEHDFVHPTGKWAEGEHMIVDSLYSELSSDSRYAARSKANEVSYIWDRLIGIFTQPILAGTIISPEGQPAEIALHERAVRAMALANRVQRRSFGAGILEAIEQARDAPRFARALIPGERAQNRETGFFFMTLECPPEFQFQKSESAYEKYRSTRRAMLEAYAFGFMKRYPFLSQIVGIGMEAPPKPGQNAGGSQDLIMLEQPEWTPEVEQLLARRTKELNILQGSGVEQHRGVDEWPLPQDGVGGSP